MSEYNKKKNSIYPIVFVIIAVLIILPLIPGKVNEIIFKGTQLIKLIWNVLGWTITLGGLISLGMGLFGLFNSYGRVKAIQYLILGLMMVYVGVSFTGVDIAIFGIDLGPQNMGGGYH